MYIYFLYLRFGCFTAFCSVHHHQNTLKMDIYIIRVFVMPAEMIKFTNFIGDQNNHILENLEEKRDTKTKAYTSPGLADFSAMYLAECSTRLRAVAHLSQKSDLTHAWRRPHLAA